MPHNALHAYESTSKETSALCVRTNRKRRITEDSSEKSNNAKKRKGKEQKAKNATMVCS